MTHLPFNLSADAAAWIEKTLVWAQREPELIALRPAIGVGSNATVCDSSGKIIDHYPGQFFTLGWYRPDQLSDSEWSEWSELDLVGFKIVVSSETLKKLTGKTLMLKSGTTRERLIAR